MDASSTDPIVLIVPPACFAVSLPVIYANITTQAYQHLVIKSSEGRRYGRTITVQMRYVVLLPQRRWCDLRGVREIVIKPRYANPTGQRKFGIFAHMVERQTEDCDRYLRSL